MKKIIAVVGATGAQGGGLVRAVLDDPDGGFAVRALTRDPSSAKARELAERGAEVVTADLDDEASVRAAFDGVHGVFAVTNYWERRSPEQAAARSAARMELDQVATLAAAAADAGVKHLVWSTLEDTRPHFARLGSDVPVLEDGYTVPHFDAKAEANALFAASGVPTTFLETTAFYEFFLSGMPVRRGDDGRVLVTLPLEGSTLPMVAAEDIGRTAYGIFRAGPRYVGRFVGLAGDHVSGPELAELFAKSLGEPVDYRPVTAEQLRAGGFPAAEELGNMFQFYAEAADSLVAHRDLAKVRELNPRLQSFEEWLAEHAVRV